MNLPPWLCERPLFQFLIVRLKSDVGLCHRRSSLVSIPYSTIKIYVSGSNTLPSVLFQFLIVRLKWCWRDRSSSSGTWFQFLIVRLKFSNICSLYSLFIVSIPYSTIKIRLCIQTFHCILVSIPYSTIKISTTHESWAGHCSFQFLIVRLKLNGKSISA